LQDIDVVVDEGEFLKAGEMQRRQLRELARRLKSEPFLGDRIPQRLKPREFKGLPNLFRLELPDGWRALYTVASSPSEGTQVRILWIGSHSRYDRLFGY
jgi:hypothetical protein